MLDKHYGVVICSMPLVRSSIPSCQVPGRMWLNLECTCHNRSRYSSWSTQERFNRSIERRWNEIISTWAWTLNFAACCPTQWMANTLLATLTCFLHPRSWKMGEARDHLVPKTTTTVGSHVTQLQTPGNQYPTRKLRGNHTFTSQSPIVESTKAEEDSSIKL